MDNELKHYGVMGMHWGSGKGGVGKSVVKTSKTLQKGVANSKTNQAIQKTGNAIAKAGNGVRSTVKTVKSINDHRSPELMKEYKQMYKDQIRHPVASLGAQGHLIKTNPKKALSLDLKSAKALNEDTARRVANSKANNAARIARLKAMKEPTKAALKKHAKNGIVVTGKLLETAVAAESYDRATKYNAEIRQKGSLGHRVVADLMDYNDKRNYDAEFERIWAK